MKKVFFALAAIAALAACNKAEVVDRAPQTPIAFTNSFVDNNTKIAVDPSYNNKTNLIEKFRVYGAVTGAAGPVCIYKGDLVSRPADMTPTDETNLYNPATAWTCDNIQYWVPDCAYLFEAIVDGDVDGNTIDVAGDWMMPETITYDARSQKDLLFARFETTTDSAAQPAFCVNGIAPVPFTFSHLLSKVKFIARNMIEAQTGRTYQYKVYDIQINNAARKASFQLNGKSQVWLTPTEYYSGNGDDVLSFGAVKEGDLTLIPSGEWRFESEYERFMIPAKYDASHKLSISFTAALVISTETVNITKYTKDIEITLERGHAYNFIIELGNPGETINFSVEKVSGWVTEPDVPATPATPVEKQNN